MVNNDKVKNKVLNCLIIINIQKLLISLVKYISKIASMPKITNSHIRQRILKFLNFLITLSIRYMYCLLTP